MHPDFTLDFSPENVVVQTDDGPVAVAAYPAIALGTTRWEKDAPEVASVSSVSKPHPWRRSYKTW
jgi:hypothetical protein